MPPVLGTLQHQSSSGAGKHRATLPSHSQPKIENSSLEHGGRGSAGARRKTGDLPAMRGLQGKIIGRLWAPVGIYNNPRGVQASNVRMVENVGGLSQELRPDALLQREERPRVAQVKLDNLRPAEGVSPDIERPRYAGYEQVVVEVGVGSDVLLVTRSDVRQHRKLVVVQQTIRNGVLNLRTG